MSVPNEYTLPSLTEAPRLETTTTGWLALGTIGVGALLETITGTLRSQAATLCAFNLAMTGVPAGRSMPDMIEPVRAMVELPALVPVSSPVPHTRRTPLAPSPMTELRERTQLSVVQLAELFNVTRPTIYSWERGTPPRGEREAHLLEALAFARNASDQFPEARAFKQWLMTPIAPALDTPLSLMAQRRWRPLRGLLLQARQPTSPLPTPEPLQSVARPMARAELRRALRNLSPPPAREDWEDAESEAGDPSTQA